MIPARLTFPLTFLALLPALAMTPTHAQDADGGAPAGTADTLANRTFFKGNQSRTGETTTPVPLPLNLIWRNTPTDAPAGSYPTSPIVLGEVGQRRVYFAAGSNIFCVDGQTGEQIWKSGDLTGFVAAPLTLLSDPIQGDLILATSNAGQLVALNAADGSQPWTASVASPISDAAPILVSTAAGQRIVLVTADGKILGFQTNGQLDKNFQTRLGQFGSSPVGTPALSPDGKLLFVATNDNRIFVLDVTTLQTKFAISTAVPVAGSPAVIGGQVIVGVGNAVQSYDVTTGNPLWSSNVGGPVSDSPSGRANADGSGQIFGGTNDGNFFALDLRTGRTAWKANLGSSITGIPLVSPRSVLIGTNSGELIGLDSAKGTILWRYRLDASRQVPVSTNNNNGRGGGNFGGGNTGRGNTGRGGQNGRQTTELRSFGVSGGPVAVDTSVYLIANSAQLYAFDSRAFDAQPPLITQPSLSVQNTQQQINTTLINPNTPQQITGKPPLYFSALLTDSGSGFDPAGIRVSVDGKELASSLVTYDVSRGAIVATLIGPPAANQPQVNLANGPHTFTVTVKDYQGNALNYSSSFVVDSTLPTPEPLNTNNNGRGNDGRGTGRGNDARGNGRGNDGNGLGTGRNPGGNPGFNPGFNPGGNPGGIPGGNPEDGDDNPFGGGPGDFGPDGPGDGTGPDGDPGDEGPGGNPGFNPGNNRNGKPVQG